MEKGRLHLGGEEILHGLTEMWTGGLHTAVKKILYPTAIPAILGQTPSWRVGELMEKMGEHHV
jgi:hypothetical protein